jgi:hypothetical protein
VLMQLTGRNQSSHFLGMFGGSIAHVSKNNRTFFPVYPIVVSNYFKKLTNTCIFDIIQASSFTYFNGHIL